MGLGIEGNNVSEKYKFQWIAPERTGSRKVAEILNYYEFKCAGLPVHGHGLQHYTHIWTNNVGPDYKTICNARNPYGRTYSLFKNFHTRIKDKSKNGFKEYVLYGLTKGDMSEMVSRPKISEPFDYVIRLEHMKDDLMRLPFILDVLTESQLEMLTSHGKEIENWEEFYDDDMKEIVYGYTESQFRFWGYEK